MVATVFLDVPFTLFLTGFGVLIKSAEGIVIEAEAPLSANKGTELEMNHVYLAAFCRGFIFVLLCNRPEGSQQQTVDSYGVFCNFIGFFLIPKGLVLFLPVDLDVPNPIV